MVVQNVLRFDGSFLKYEGLKAVCEYSAKEKSEISVTWHKNRHNDLVLKFIFKGYLNGKLFGEPSYDEIITDDFNYALEVINSMVLDYVPFTGNTNVEFKYVTVFAKESSTGKWVKKGVYSKKLLEKSKSIVLKSAPMNTTMKSYGMTKKLAKKPKSTRKISAVKRMTGNIEALGENFKKLI